MSCPATHAAKPVRGRHKTDARLHRFRQATSATSLFLICVCTGAKSRVGGWSWGMDLGGKSAASWLELLVQGWDCITKKESKWEHLNCKQEQERDVGHQIAQLLEENSIIAKIRYCGIAPISRHQSILPNDNVLCHFKSSKSHPFNIPFPCNAESQLHPFVISKL